VMKRLALVAALAAVVALAASGPATASSWPHAAGGLAAGGSHRSAVGEKLVTRVFLRRVAESNLFEIRKSQLALKRAKSPAVRDIAQLFVADHTAELGRLRALADRFGVRLPAQPNRMQRAQLALLGHLSGARFDRVWLHIQVLAHLQAIALYRFGARFAAPPVREHAAATLPVLRHHLQLVLAAAGHR
jgi:putative membrane protein